MARRFHETMTTTKPAPLPADVAYHRGSIKRVDGHKRAERRKVLLQEERAWRAELDALYA